MNVRKGIQIGCALVLGLALYMPAAHADERNQESRFTFNQPVQVSPNMILAPGAYTFRLADMQTYPNNMVLIYDNNTGRYVGSVLTETTSRRTILQPNWPGVSNKLFTEDKLTFASGPNHYTLVDWFYAGDMYGHQFIYPAREEKALSEQPLVTVMAAPIDRHPSKSLVASNQ